MPDAGTRTGFGRPGANPANTDDTKLRSFERRKGGFTEYPAETFEAIFIGWGQLETLWLLDLICTMLTQT